MTQERGDWSDVTTSQGMRAVTGSRKKQGRDSPRKSMALPTPSFQTSGLQNVREDICVVLSHQVCGNLLQQPQENQGNGKRYHWEDRFRWGKGVVWEEGVKKSRMWGTKGGFAGLGTDSP